MPRGTDDNVFTDLSGTSNSTTDNPYDALLEACNHEPVITHSNVRVVGLLIAIETNPASLSDTPGNSKRPAEKQIDVPRILRVFHR